VVVKSLRRGGRLVVVVVTRPLVLNSSTGRLDIVVVAMIVVLVDTDCVRLFSEAFSISRLRVVSFEMGLRFHF